MAHELEKNAYALIVYERAKQINCGFDAAHDAAHDTGEIARMMAFFALPGPVALQAGFVVDPEFLLPEAMRCGEKLNRSTESNPDDIAARIRDIVKGLACGVAEVERLQRLAGVDPDILGD